MILVTLNFSSANAFNLVKGKILSFGKELTLSQTTKQQNWKAFETTIWNWMKKEESYLSELKTLWEKEKLLITSNFFSQSVFKRHFLQTRKNQGLFGNGLTEIHEIPFCLNKTHLREGHFPPFHISSTTHLSFTYDFDNFCLD